MHTNPFQTLLNDYHQDREKQEHHNFIEEEKRRHASHHLQGRGAEWRPFLVAPRRAAGASSSSSSSASLRCWPATMTPATSASPRGTPVFSFDAIHRPFCASPTTTWTPAPPAPMTPWSLSSSSASSSSWSLREPPSWVHDDVSTRPPRRGRLVLPALTDPEPPVPAAAARRQEVPNVVNGVGVDVDAGESSSSPAAMVVVEESADCALLSLVTLSCATSPASSPARQPSTPRLVRAANACAKFAELRKKRKREDAADTDHHELTYQPTPASGGDGADHGDHQESAEMGRRPVVAGDRAHKRRRGERASDDTKGVECSDRAHDQKGDSTGREINGERPHEAQQGTEDSDVEADHCSDTETEFGHGNGRDQGDADSKAAGEDHGDERGLGILMLGEESANEDEEEDDDEHQHQHQKTVMEMVEMVTETTSPHPQAAGRRGPRRIWASISARELEGLRLYAPMPPGSRRTRVSRMGLHHFFHRAHAARPAPLAT